MKLGGEDDGSRSRGQLHTLLHNQGAENEQEQGPGFKTLRPIISDPRPPLRLYLLKVP